MIAEAKTPAMGAIVTFPGIVRDNGIERMELEACEDVAVREFDPIGDAAAERFRLRSVDVVHRIGSLQVNDSILPIIVGAAHRKEAFAGCESILERIKERIPVWKKEIAPRGARWAEGNPGP